MKAVFSFVLLVVAALVIYAYMQGPSRPDEVPQPAPVAAPPAPAPPAAPMAPNPAPRPAAPAAQPNNLPRILAVAKQVGVNVQSTRQEGKDLWVQVEWMGNVATIGGDFVEALYRQGIIRDFQEETGRPWVDDQGRYHWTQAYTLKF